jgi:hypothetical protein
MTQVYKIRDKRDIKINASEIQGIIIECFKYLYCTKI